MTAIVVWTQLSDYVDDLYKPGIGIKVCWLDSKYDKKKRAKLSWIRDIYFTLRFKYSMQKPENGQLPCISMDQTRSF